LMSPKFFYIFIFEKKLFWFAFFLTTLHRKIILTRYVMTFIRIHLSPFRKQQPHLGSLELCPRHLWWSVFRSRGCC
jgi:hypothetical protein